MNLTPSFLAVFPGQGSQYVGMGKDLYDNFSFIKEIYEEASDAIHLDLKKLCFDGPESDLQLTENTQPCLLLTSVAAYRVVEKVLGLTPAAAAGHSLGEYSALVATHSIAFSDAVRWVRNRGLAMQQAVPAGLGKMAAILNLEDEQVYELCKKATLIAEKKRKDGLSEDLTIPALVEPANFNAPGQVVIAGSTDALEEALSLIKTDPEFSRGKSILLQVSAPFHCQLMRPARDKLASLFAGTTAAQKPKNGVCPYVPNRTARLTHESNLIFENLIEQVDHPVLWKQSISNLLSHQFRNIVEFGPGKVLIGTVKRIAAQVSVSCTLAAVGDSAGLKNLEKSFDDIAKQQLLSESTQDLSAGGSLKRTLNTESTPLETSGASSWKPSRNH